MPAMLLSTFAKAKVVAVAGIVQVAIDWVTHTVEEDQCAAMKHGLHDPEVLPPLKVVCASIQPDEIALGPLVLVILGP